MSDFTSQLIEASHEGNLEVVKETVEKGADVNAEDGILNF